MKTVVFGGSYGERKVSKDLGGAGGFRWLTWEMEGTDLTDQDLAHFLFVSMACTGDLPCGIWGCVLTFLV